MSHAKDSGLHTNQSLTDSVAVNGHPVSTRFDDHRPNARFLQYHSRTGAALVEFAVLMPVLMVVVFGTIEAASMIFLKQTLVQASYESAKVLARRDGTEVGAIRVANEVANGRRIDSLDIRFEPSNIQSVPRGTFIRVTTSAPANANSLTGFSFAGNRRVSAFAVMVKE